MTPKLFIKVSLIVGILLSATIPSLAEGKVHFVGFNSLKTENKAHHQETFDAYIRKLKPILAKYGVITDVYDVVFGGDGSVSVVR